MASIARITRSAVLEVLRADYIRTARAKGLPEFWMLAKHTLRNAAIPIVTITGLQFGTLLGGAVVTETVFAWPGIGRLAMQSIYNRDYPVVQSTRLPDRGACSWVNLLVDVSMASSIPASAGAEAGSGRRARAVPRAGAPLARWGRGVAFRRRAAGGGGPPPRGRASGPDPADAPRPARRAGWRARPASAHLLGTDHLGRDVLSGVIYGSRVSLVGFSAVLVGGVGGCWRGSSAGFSGGCMDEIIMTVADAQLAFPFILLAIGIIAVLGPSFPTLIVVVGLSGWVTYARGVRARRCCCCVA